MAEQLLPSLEQLLKPIELRVLGLATDGLKNVEIAERLSLPPKAVDHMLSNDPFRGIFWKIDVANRAQAARRYTEEFGGGKDLPAEIVEYARVSLKFAKDTRLQGNLSLAEAEAAYLAKLLDQSARKTQSEAYFLELLRIRARALQELQSAYKGAYPLKEVWRLTKPIADEIRRVGIKSKDAELLGLSEQILGDTYHILGDHEKSILHLSNALASLKNPDDQLLVVRGLLLDFAYTIRRDAHKDMLTKMRELIASGQFASLECAFLGLEGLGRSQGILNSSRAFKTFEEAQTYLSKLRTELRNAPLLEIQLVRSELDVVTSYLTLLPTKLIDMLKPGRVSGDKTISHQERSDVDQSVSYVAQSD